MPITGTGDRYEELQLSQDAELRHRAHRYAAQAWDSLPPPLKRWIPEDRLRAELAGSVSEVLDRIHDMETATGFRSAVPVPGTTPEDYLFKVLTVDQDRSFVAGLRYRPDPEFFFVVIYARDYAIESAQTLAKMGDAVGRAFSSFSPRYMSADIPPGHSEGQVVSGSSVKIDLITVAGLLSELHRLDSPPNMGRVLLQRATSTEFYERYMAEYATFHEEAPHLRESVLPTPFDKLEQCMAQELLYEAYVDGEWAGVIAAREQTDHGMRGYRVVEEILASRFRGRGFGPALQRRFIDVLPAGDHAILHGAIDPANAPSLAAAKRVGRVEVMHTRFVALG